MIPKKYWRLDPASAVGAEVGLSGLRGPEKFVAKLERGDGIVLATWDGGANVGRVVSLGVVRSVAEDPRIAHVEWREKKFELTPGAQGGRAQ